MTIWLDAHLSPKLASLICTKFQAGCTHVRDLGLLSATDQEIYDAGKAAKAVILSKDQDLKDLVLRLGAPPQVLWLTLGNCSTQDLFALPVACGCSQAFELEKYRFLSIELLAPRISTRRSWTPKRVVHRDG